MIKVKELRMAHKISLYLWYGLRENKLRIIWDTTTYLFAFTDTGLMLNYKGC